MATLESFVLWAPRVLGLALAGFLGLFALDAFAPGKSLGSALVEFVIHLLPAVAVCAVVALAWQRAWIGAIAFAGLAVAYAVMVPSRPDWILIISGPLLVAAILFFWSWRRTVQG